jgi:hypothetical protein
VAIGNIEHWYVPITVGCESIGMSWGRTSAASSGVVLVCAFVLASVTACGEDQFSASDRHACRRMMAISDDSGIETGSWIARIERAAPDGASVAAITGSVDDASIRRSGLRLSKALNSLGKSAGDIALMYAAQDQADEAVSGLAQSCRRSPES